MWRKSPPSPGPTVRRQARLDSYNLKKWKATLITKFTLYFLLVTSWACQPPGKNAATHDARDHNHEAKGYVLQKHEGEVLNDPRGRKMIIKVSPQRGAAHLTMGTTGMPKGTGIFVHRHEHAEEILFVH